MGGKTSLPRVFLNGSYLGGAKEIEELVEDYKLHDILKATGAESTPCGPESTPCGPESTPCGGLQTARHAQSDRC
eukprot:722403-Prorocentrum_minimum.AAC.2